MASSSRRILPLVFLCGLALQDGTAAAGEPVVDLDEVAVIGKSLRKLQREVIEAEDRFYERFNTLNTSDEFDIHCQMDKATGTRVPKRQCRIRFLADAAAMDGQEFLRGLTSAAAAPGVNAPLAALQPQWLQRRDEYRQTARALLEKNPELSAVRFRRRQWTGRASTAATSPTRCARIPAPPTHWAA